MKQKAKRKLLALVLALVLCISQVNLSAATAYAASSEVAAETVEEVVEEGSSEEATAGTEATEAEVTEEDAPEAEPDTESAAEMVTTETEPNTEAATEESTAEAEPVIMEEEEAEAEEEVAVTVLNASNYTTTTTTLKSKANDTVTISGTEYPCYNNYKDSSIDLDYIAAIGTRYARCVGKKTLTSSQTQTTTTVSTSTVKKYYYLMQYDNNIGSFTTTGFVDVNNKRHGNSHFVKKYYKTYTLTVTRYRLIVTDEDAMTKDRYDIYYVSGSTSDTTYTSTGDSVMTYCIGYGDSLTSSNTDYVEALSSYTSLTDAKQKKIAMAINYGPHINANGTYYAYIGKTLSAYDSSIKGYDASTWTKAFWKRYIATQLYIWTVQSSSFSESDAVATAQSIDSNYSTSNADLCEEFLKEIISYVSTAETVPSFTQDTKAKAGADENLKKLDNQTSTGWYGKFQDKKGILNDGYWQVYVDGSWQTVDSSGQVKVSDTQTVTVTNSSKSMLKVSVTAAIDVENGDEPVYLRFVKNQSVPKEEQGEVWLASSKVQNMRLATISGTTKVKAFLAVYTDTPTGAKISLYKSSAVDDSKPVSGAQFIVLAESKKAAVYDPDTGTTMVDGDVNEKMTLTGYITIQEQLWWMGTAMRMMQMIM